MNRKPNRLESDLKPPFEEIQNPIQKAPLEAIFRRFLGDSPRSRFGLAWPRVLHIRGSQTEPRFIESSRNRVLESSSKPRFENSSGAVFKTYHGDSDFDHPPF